MYPFEGFEVRLPLFFVGNLLPVPLSTPNPSNKQYTIRERKIYGICIFVFRFKEKYNIGENKNHGGFIL